MASIMDMFSKPKAPEVPAVAKPQDTTPDNPEVNNPNNPAKSSENPIDKYQKMFDNAVNDSDIQAPSFKLDPVIVADVSSKLDFTKGINPELLQKAQGGDASAIMELIKSVGSNAYRASLEHTTSLTDAYLNKRTEFDNKRLSKGVKEQLTSDALNSNPNFKHPVIKAELNRIAKQMAASPEYVDASPKDIAEAAATYLTELHNAMNPADPSKTKEGKQKPDEVDYMKYITG